MQVCRAIVSPISLEHASLLISEEWPLLAYIGTDSSTAQRVELDHRSSRFRLGDKRVAAGAAVAVISLGFILAARKTPPFRAGM